MNEHVFKNSTLELMSERLKDYREKLMKAICYISSVDTIKNAEYKGKLLGIDETLLACEELDNELGKKDEAR